MNFPIAMNCVIWNYIAWFSASASGELLLLQMLLIPL